MRLRRRVVCVLCLALLSPSLFWVAYGRVRVGYGLPVRNVNTGLSYSSIQESIDAGQTLDGHTIHVDAGTYHEHVTVEKRLSLVGEGPGITILDGGGAEVVVDAAWYVNISGFTVRNGTTGISAQGHCRIVGNDVRQVTGTTIMLDDWENLVLDNHVEGDVSVNIGSDGNTIERNNVTGSIQLDYAGDNNTVSENRLVGGTIGLVHTDGNNVTRNSVDNDLGYNGIYLFASSDDVIIGNEVFNCNYDGISVSSFCNNLTIIENTVKTCGTAIYLTGSMDETSSRTIYHNNFINNGFGVLLNGPSQVQWDNGYPSGGNFWSDYNGTDAKKGPRQNETGRDGIGDTPYTCTEGWHGGFQDQYPLVNPFPYDSFFNVTDVVFDVADTAHFNVTLHSSALCLVPVNIVKIAVVLENRTVEDLSHDTVPSLPCPLSPDSSVTVSCGWDWSGYQYRDVSVAVSSGEGYTGYARQKTLLIKAGLIRVPQDYGSIGEAVDNANPGDTVFVSSGTYHEHLTINKRLTLAGQDMHNTIIDGGGEDANIIQVSASLVNITGFTMQNTHRACVHVYSEFGTLENVVISRNIIKSNDDWGDGLDYSGDNGVVSENQVSNCFYGLGVGGDNNTVTGNDVTSCSSWELDIGGCSNSVLSDNTFGSTIISGSTGNTFRRNKFSKVYFYNLDTLSDAMNDIDASNLLNGKKIYYLVNQKNLLIDPVEYPDAGFLGLVNCSNIIVNGLTLESTDLSSMGQTMLMAFTNDSLLVNMRLQNEYEGIRLFQCVDNAIIHNNITDCWFGVTGENFNHNVIRGNTLACLYGLDLTQSENNTIYHNNFMDHWRDTLIDGSAGSWDDGKEGNYWTSYNGTDANHDGIGDTPMNLDQKNEDRYPLMNEWTPSTNDVTVARVLLPSSQVCVGQVINITGVVRNEGKETVTFNVTYMCDGTPINTCLVSNLTSWEQVTLNLMWNTTGLAPMRNYTIRVEAAPVQGETALDNNAFTVEVRMNIRGDLNGDDKVDMKDVSYIARRFRCLPDDPLWDSVADINTDGKIDMKDISIVARHFGEHYP